MERFFKALRPIVNRMLPARPMAVRVLFGPARGFQLMIEPRTEKYYWRGGHEPAVGRALCQLLRPGNIFWDIGAHIGYMSLIGSRLVGQGGQVHAFEPQQGNVGRLNEAVRLNAVTNLTIHPVAVSDIDGLGIMRRHESSLMQSLVEEDEFGEEVRCVTLNSMLATLGPPDVIKIDVEGGELRVLAGAERVLRQHPSLIIELLTDANRALAQNVLVGWSFERLDGHNWLVRHHP